MEFCIGMWCNWCIWNIGEKLGKSVLIKKSEFSNIFFKAHRTIGITFFLTRPLWNLLLKPTKIKWQIFGSHRQFSAITRVFWDCGKTKQKWYFVTKIVLTYCEKELFQWSRKTWVFEITRTIYSYSERSEQFLVTECFFNLFLEVSHI